MHGFCRVLSVGQNGTELGQNMDSLSVFLSSAERKREKKIMKKKLMVGTQIAALHLWVSWIC
jgi:hypothetical protein